MRHSEQLDLILEKQKQLEQQARQAEPQKPCGTIAPTHCDPKTHRCAMPVKSKASNRRFLAGVVSADLSSDRTTKFLAKWAKAWPELEFTVQMTFMNSVKVRGYGCIVSELLIMEDALARDQDSFDYLMVFEDDGLPFDEVTWPNVAPNDFDKRLDMLEERDGDLLLLGGHSVRVGSRSIPSKESVEKELPEGIFSLNWSWGSYAWVIRKRFLLKMVKAFREEVQAKTGPGHVADEAWWPALRKGSPGGGFISVPLLVDHAKGYSETWKKDRSNKQKFEGHRDWWNYPRN